MRIDRKTLSGGTLLLLLNLLFAVSFFIYERYLEEKPALNVEGIDPHLSGNARDRASYVPDTLFAFDPNELSMKGWKRLGLSEEQASVILNYRKSGGRFFEEEDLLKVYSLGKEHVHAWKDSLIFPEDPPSEKKRREEASVKKWGQDENEKGDEFELFPFDPNRLPEKGWIKLGLSPEQAKVALRFRKEGAKFWKASDLLRIYVVDSFLYRKWKPYVRIDREALKIAIDRAGKKELKGLPGIGERLAGRIVEYRDLLGGFHRKEQLGEVYGITDSLSDALMDRVKVKGGGLEPIPLDTTAERLMQHPYIDPSTADAIVEHRERYGPFEEKTELHALDLLGDEEYRKIAPYLELPSHEQ